MNPDRYLWEPEEWWPPEEGPRRTRVSRLSRGLAPGIVAQITSIPCQCVWCDLRRTLDRIEGEFAQRQAERVGGSSSAAGPACGRRA